MRKAARNSAVLYAPAWVVTKSLLLSLAILRPPAATGGELSLKCIYSIMTSVHEGMKLCGDVLDPTSEATYHELRAALKKFINDNAIRNVDRIGPDYDETERRGMKEMVPNGFCRPPKYAVWKEVLQMFLKTQSSIRKRLEIPGDPREGECL